MFLLPLLIALEASPAGAATVEFSVHGLERVRSVVLVTDGGSGVQVAPCRDDGQQSDLGIDGTWTCEPVTAIGAEIWIALLTDSEAVAVGAVPISSARLKVGLEKTIDGVVIQTGPQESAPASGAKATPPGLILLTRLRTKSTQGAPMLQVETEGVVEQHPCRDDGGMFDEQLNEQRWRTMVRGSCVSYTMPWEDILKELRENCEDVNLSDLPRKGACLKYLMRIGVKSKLR